MLIHDDLLNGSFQVRSKENMLVRRRKRVSKMNENVKAIQEMVETELADNKYSEYLMKIFKTTDHQEVQGDSPDSQSQSSSTDQGQSRSSCRIHLTVGLQLRCDIDLFCLPFSRRYLTCWTPTVSFGRWRVGFLFSCVCSNGSALRRQVKNYVAFYTKATIS